MKKIKKFFDREQNLLIHIIATILVTIFGIIFNLKAYEWLLVYSMVTFVITSELINSAIELTVDLYTSHFNPLAMVAKDVAAAAVVTSAFTALCVGLYVFLPKFINLFANLDVEHRGNFSNGYYLSSSEYNNIYAWFQYFFDGSQNYYDRYIGSHVRPIRAFSL